MNAKQSKELDIATVFQRDEWLVCRRYLSAESMGLLDAAIDEDDETEENKREEVMHLNAA